ncbi:MAG: hypothetical protein RLY95_601 [Pseudomonadota bacterium]|jgi:hypothetical protein
MHSFAKSSFLKWIVLGLLLWMQASYAETCQLDVPGQVVLPNHDPSASSRSQYALTIRVRAVTACTVRLQVDRLDSLGEVKLSGASVAGLRVGLNQDASYAVPLQAAPNDIASWKLAAGQIATYAIWISPLIQQWVSAGFYQAPIHLRLLNSSGSTLDDRDVVLIAKLDATTKITFAGNGSRASRLDFGEISAGAIRSAVLDVWANATHRITLTSQNRGYMQNARMQADASDAKIAYSVRLSGQPMTLSTGVASVAVQNLGQTRHQLDVEIGAVQRLLAGEYMDDLLITVVAQ